MEIKEVKVKKSKKKRYILLYFAIVAFAVYAIFTLVSINSQIKEKKSELEGYQDEIKIVELKNNELEEAYEATGDSYEKLVEDKAREELDYVKDGERVFENVAGE